MLTGCAGTRYTAVLKAKHNERIRICSLDAMRGLQALYANDVEVRCRLTKRLHCELQGPQGASRARQPCARCR